MVAADVTIGFVLQPERAARMVAQHAVDSALPGLDQVLDRLVAATFNAPATSPYEQEVRRAEKRVLVDRIMWLAWASPNAQVRALASAALSQLASRASSISQALADRAAHALLAKDIQRFLNRPAAPARSIAPPAAPPGAPIGDVPMDWLAPPPWR